MAHYRCWTYSDRNSRKLCWIASDGNDISFKPIPSLQVIAYLTDYLKDGRLELRNNRAERSIKPFVISRKKFLFANTLKGVMGSAVIFTPIQTTIENCLEPYKYLTWLMKTAKDADLSWEDTIQNLLLWNAPTEYRSK